MVEALDKAGIRDNTLILFQADNGGTRNPMFSGEVDTSTLKSLPPDNGPYREGKGTVYEGGTRVVAIANWPGRIKPGTVVNEMIHEVDLFPTLLGLAGASAARQAARRHRRLGDDQRGQALAPHRDRLRPAADARGLEAGRLEARLAHAAPPGVELYDIGRTRRRRRMSPPTIPKRSRRFRRAPTSSRRR